ncbi:MAG: hypothetical protein JW837_08645 [Sedimentisphaerales bacterium]|nr:hypothetical protein [Sedimentisphaerales bacterium]
MNAIEIDSTTKQIVDGKETLWRGITTPDWIKRCDDGTYRTSSAAFKGFKNVSVDIASKTTKEKSKRKFKALAAFLAEIPKKFGHEVYEDPIIPDNPAHAIISGKIKGRAATEISHACEWAVAPNQD